MFVSPLDSTRKSEFQDWISLDRFGSDFQCWELRRLGVGCWAPASIYIYIYNIYTHINMCFSFISILRSSEAILAPGLIEHTLKAHACFLNSADHHLGLDFFFFEKKL